jgi:hypothetical protein
LCAASGFLGAVAGIIMTAWVNQAYARTAQVLKDISTVRHRPQRLWEWARIASEVAQAAS